MSVEATNELQGWSPAEGRRANGHETGAVEYLTRRRVAQGCFRAQERLKEQIRPGDLDYEFREQVSDLVDS